MHEAEVFEMFRPILEQGKQRRRITDYAALALLVIVLVAWGMSAYRNRHVPKIESLALVPNSLVIIGPAQGMNEIGKLEFCPGDVFTVQFELEIKGEGAIYADDAAHYQKHITVKFSDLWRDVVQPGRRLYQDSWLIPAQPEMAINGKRAWIAGEYERVLLIAPSNLYVSRYVPPVPVKVPFTVKENC